MKTLGKKLVEVQAKALLNTMKEYSKTQWTMWKLSFCSIRLLIR